MLTADNATLHAKMVAATTADNASKAAHTDLNNAIAGSQANARKLAQRIKKSTGYTTVIGNTLQLEGAEDSTDMTQEQPVLDAEAQPAGVAAIGFNKLDAEGVHIYSQRDGDAGSPCLPAKPIRLMWTTGHCWRRANRRRGNTRPCSSSAKPKSACPAPSSSPPLRHKGVSPGIDNGP